jgi:uracil-DNA glycosylase
VAQAWEALAPDYRHWLESGTYLPGRDRLFRAFATLPRSQVRYVLFGQDPYPRPESATGYAFIDGAVERIFSPTGLSKAVNRATSLRNFVKMALLADGRLGADDLSQQAIAAIDKRDLIDSIDALRRNFERAGVLLLNTALVFETKGRGTYHARMWRPFMRALLASLDAETGLILFGRVAETVEALAPSKRYRRYRFMHPYNLAFVTDTQVQALFGPMHLLRADTEGNMV